MDAHDVLTVLWWCVKPSTVAPASLLAGIGLVTVGRRRVGIAALAVCALVLVNALVLPTTRMLARALEQRVLPVPELPPNVDGIIVLGGNGAVRLPPFAELAARYPEATLVFSGGGDESGSARSFLRKVGGLADRTIYEDRSRNTVENARFSQEAVRPEVDEVWVLITSAMHMARAMRTFEEVGWSVIPYPVGFSIDAPQVGSPILRIGSLDEAIREYLVAAVDGRRRSRHCSPSSTGPAAVQEPGS